ncbi:hypothetical protein JAO85_13795 [Comamonas sp. NyZ500]|uniref:hypothetical protein n=1 Tax=Comamonas sp. NyZ500 TaxID=2795732 RepID=UPI00192B1202|nr:hypothetical protein [Comamonas sp. NyZ500]MBL5978358.1 hypothetical protein [Comamonas sp. NyZ500]
MQKYKSNLTSVSGAAVRGASITVLDESGVIASIFLDRAGTLPAGNPLKTGQDGTFEFYAANGRYSLRTDSSGLNVLEEDVILLFDPDDATVSGPIADAIQDAKDAADAAQESADAAQEAADKAQQIADNTVPTFDTYALAVSKLASVQEGMLVEISQDENRLGARTRYRKVSGVLTFVSNLDQLRIDLDEPTAGGASIVAYQAPGGSAQSVDDKLDKILFVNDFATIDDAVNRAVALGIKRLYLAPGASVTFSSPVDMKGVGLVGNTTTINDTSNLLNVGRITGCVVRGFATDHDYIEPQDNYGSISPKLVFRKATDILCFITKRRGTGYVSSEHWWNSFTSNETDTGGASESWRNCVTRFFSEVFLYRDDGATTGAWGAKTVVPVSASFPTGTLTAQQLTYQATNELNATMSWSVNSKYGGRRGQVAMFGTTGSATQIELYVNGVLQKTFSAQTTEPKLVFVQYELPQTGANTVMLKKVSGLAMNVIGADFATLSATDPELSYTALAFGDYGRPYVAGNSAMDYAFFEYNENKWFGSVHGGETQRVEPAFYVDGARTDIPATVGAFVVGKYLKLIQRTTIATGASSLSVDKTYNYVADSVVGLDVAMNGNANVKTAYTAMCATHTDFGFITYPYYQDVTAAANNRVGRRSRITQADYTRPSSTRFLTTECTLHPMGGATGANMLGNGPFISAQSAYNKFYYGPCVESRAQITRVSFSTKWIFE